MTKNEYLEFTNLQEHYEWLHAAEDRAKTKLETFTTDDSEFDELVREAIKVYFETEIDKAWKKIEEFKTATAKTGNTRSISGIKYCIFKNPDGAEVRIPLDILEKADRCCDEFDCDDPRNPCPFKDGHTYCRFRYCFNDGCPDILERFKWGHFKIEEVDK